MTIYLDNNATTPISPEVASAMMTAMIDIPGNPSSLHRWGRAARTALQQAREVIAAQFGVATQEVLFHSGGTEGLNQIINSLPEGHIITSNVEHACVNQLLSARKNVTFLDAGKYGALTAEQVQAALTPETVAVITLAVNNETGVITDIPAIAEVTQRYGIPLIVDGVCWLGKMPIQFPAGVTAAVFSGHKFHAPKGVGFTIVRRGFKLKPFILGGPQEQGKRGGTENLPAIVGLAKALTVINDSSEIERITALRKYFEDSLFKALPHAKLNGEGPRVCNTVNIAFENVDGESLLANLDIAGVAASHGSACSSGAREPSRILVNMGYPQDRVRSSIRFSLSRMTQKDEIDKAIQIVIKAASKK